MLRADFQRGISALEKYKLTYDILIYPNQLEEAILLVEKFPNQQFILDHCAKPYIKDDWPVSLLAGNYSTTLSLVENYIQKFTKSEQQQIMGLNAKNLYDIKD